MPFIRSPRYSTINAAVIERSLRDHYIVAVSSVSFLYVVLPIFHTLSFTSVSQASSSCKSRISKRTRTAAHLKADPTTHRLQAFWRTDLWANQIC
jgi:hypothetical protein